MGNEIVIICSAYPHIENVLYLLWNHYQSRPITLVVHGGISMFKFYSAMNEKVFHNMINIKHVALFSVKQETAVNIIGRVINVVRGVFKERRYLKNAAIQELKGLRGADVYFLKRYYAGNEYYFLKNLADANKLIYMPSRVYDYLSIDKTKPKNIKELAYLIRWKLAYGFGISMDREATGTIAPYIPDAFFKRHVHKILKSEERNLLLQGFDMRQFQVFDTGNYSILYFHDNLVPGGYISDSESYNELLFNVVDAILRHVPENKVALKYHPSPDEREIIIRKGTILPDYIPAEFLYNDGVKMYLGLSSMALANVEKGLVVSMVDMVTFRDDSTRQSLKDGLMQASKTTILFPKTLEEFEEILVKLV